MSASLEILFAILIVAPGLLVPLLVLTRMYRIPDEQGRRSAGWGFTGGTT